MCNIFGAINVIAVLVGFLVGASLAARMLHTQSSVLQWCAILVGGCVSGYVTLRAYRRLLSELAKRSKTGPVHTKHLCTREAWSLFCTRLQSGGFHIATRGMLEQKNLFMDIRVSSDGPRGVWLTVILCHATRDPSLCVSVELVWFKSANEVDHLASCNLAANIERLLTTAVRDSSHSTA